MTDLKVFIVLYIVINLSFYLTVINIDLYEKEKEMELYKLNRFKFLFLRNKIKKQLIGYIGKLSLKYQIFHLIFSISSFVFLVINTYVIKIDIIFIILFFCLLLYFIFCVLMRFKYIEKTKMCGQKEWEEMKKERERQYAEIERQKIIDKFTQKD